MHRLPVTEGFVDWDCAEALEIPDMEATLTHIEEQGTLPVRQDHSNPPSPSPPFPHDPTLTLPQPTHESKEDRNPVSACPVSPTTISSLHALVSAWTSPGQPGHALIASTPLRVCLLDGFLLFAPAVHALQRHISIKLFLRVPSSVARARRHAREGYATIEGWWADPPGYVDRVVWPNYARDHAWMFEGGDVEGRFDDAMLWNKEYKKREGRK